MPLVKWPKAASLTVALIAAAGEQGLFYQPAGIRKIFTLLSVCCSAGLGTFTALTFSFQAQAVRLYWWKGVPWPLLEDLAGAGPGTAAESASRTTER